jgi:hypothetical protein
MDDLTGKTFGQWQVLGFHHKDKYNAIYWLCKCSCGKELPVYAGNLRSGLTTRCNDCKIKYFKIHPAATTHGMSRTKTYRIYRGMISRCYDKGTVNYKDYGGRGINICNRWQNSFENFYADMGDCPEGMSINRINNNGNYELSNCKWSTSIEQANNRRNVQHDEYDKLKGTVSRQRISQLRHRRDGLCTICGKPVNMSVSLCDIHFLKRTKSKEPFRNLKRYAENKDKAPILHNT